MRTPKLNKTAQFELMTATVASAIEAHSDLLKKDKAGDLIAILTGALSAHFAPKVGGGTSTKVNEAGEVYCNYFADYFPADSFATKMSKADKETGERHEVYKANSIRAEKILRAIKSMRARVDRMISVGIRERAINGADATAILDVTDVLLSKKFVSIDEVPTMDTILAESGVTASEPV